MIAPGGADRRGGPLMGGGEAFRRRLRRDGQVLVITLLSLVLLAGLLYYVFNLGDQVNRRLEMQNAADAVAIGGANWMARCMNTVAMNNVTQARLIALVAVLDALPLAAEMAVAEETADPPLSEALEKWRSVPGGGFTQYEEDNFFRRGLAELYLQMSNTGGMTQLQLLQQIDSNFDHRDEMTTEGGFDVQEATAWPDGTIWHAMVALDEFSQAVAESAGILAQVNAAEFGRRNGAEAAFVVPVQVQFPAARTSFTDFAPVLLDHVYYWEDRTGSEEAYAYEVRRSKLVEKLSASNDVPSDCRRLRVYGGAIPDFTHPQRLGPFARLYRWRSPINEYQYSWDTWSWDISTRHGYMSYGPFEGALRTVLRQFGEPGRRGGTLDTTRFAFHLRSLSLVKLAYIFGLSSPKNVQYPAEWIIDYQAAQTFADDHAFETPQAVMTTRYYRVNVKSTAEWDDRTNWMRTWDPNIATSTFTPMRYWSRQLKTPAEDVYDPNLVYLWIEDRPGFRDVTAQAPWEKLADYVWVRKSAFQSYLDHELRLQPRFERDPNGKLLLDDAGLPTPIPYTIYSVEWRVFGGIEPRNEVPLSSPCDGADRDEMPAPILLDTSDERGRAIRLPDADGVEQDAYRVEPIMFLGVARKTARAAAWPQKFRSPNPLGSVVTIAQAKLFNASSWDLWTQDWQAQLTPIADWDLWLARLEQGVLDAGETQGIVSDEQVEDIYEYLEKFDSDAFQSFLKH